MAANKKLNHHLQLRGKVWYLRARIPGADKILLKSLRTSNEKEARQRRSIELDKLNGGADAYYERTDSKKAKHFPTVEELLESYMEWVEFVNAVEEGPSPSSAKDIRNCMIRIICARYGFQPNSSGKPYDVPERIASLPITVIDKNLPGDYQQYFWKEARNKGSKSSSTKVSVASQIRTSRSIFAEKSTANAPLTPMEWYEKQGLSMPRSVHEYRKSAGKFKQRGAAYVKPPRNLIEETLAAAETLKREDTALGTAFVLAYDLGLRAAESAWAKWDWFQPRDDGSISVKIHPVAQIVGQEKGFAPKASTVERPGRTIAIPRDTYDYLCAHRHEEPQMPLLDEPRTKLNFNMAEEIRSRSGNGEAKLALAREYGVSEALIRQVVLGKKWKSPRTPSAPTDNGEYVLPGLHFTARYRLIEDKLNAWLRLLGWTKQPGDGHSGFEKASHELRKLKGSEYYVRLGAVQARNFLGHASVSTTEFYYAALGANEVQPLYPQPLLTETVKFA